LVTKRAFKILILWLLFAFVCARFLYDVRSLGKPDNDFIAPWVSAKVFLEGKNPYSDIAEFIRVSPTKQYLSPGNCSAQGCTSYNMVYPPSTLPLLAPLTLLPWKVALWVYLLGSFALILTLLFLMARKLDPSKMSLKKQYLIGFCLAIAPLHSSIHTCNLNTLVIACMGIGGMLLDERPYMSGVALAIAMCLKPQVGFLFMVYPWLRRKWRTAFVSAGTCAGICLSSCLWMYVHHIEWLNSYLATTSAYVNSASTSGALTRVTVLSFYGADPMKYLMTNLQVLIFQFVPNIRSTNLLSWLIFAAWAIGAAIVILKQGKKAQTDAQLALLSVLTLLPIYQNFYTATILFFVIYWAMRNWPRRSAKTTLILMSPLLLPLVAITLNSSKVSKLIQSHHLNSSFIWNAFIMPHVIWIELILAVILIVDMCRTQNVAIEG
jgi:hypothetical protein